MEALSWHVILPAVGAAFLASLVEVVEAFTIVLAVGTTRGWRPALQGSLAGLAVLALHDETAAFAAERAELGGAAPRGRGAIDWLAATAAFKAVVLEGLEVVFIVIAVGAGRGLLLPAGLGALAACVLVLAAGAIVHRPLSRVPENTLKFGVGVMLSAFGVFWTGEGLGVAWPGHDLALLVFAALFLGAGLVASALARKPAMEM